jgi:hypothetical protein
MKIQKSTLLRFLEEKENVSNSDFQILQKLNNSNEESLEIEPNNASIDLLQFIIFNDSSLDYETKAKLTFDFLKPKENKEAAVDFWNIKIKGLSTIIDIYEKHLKDLDYNFDLKLDKKFVPIKAKMELQNATKFQPRRIVITFDIKMLESRNTMKYVIDNETIVYYKSINKDFNLQILLQEINLYPQSTSVSEYIKLLDKTADFRSKNGNQFLVLGTGIEISYNSMYDPHSRIKAISVNSFKNLNTTNNDGKVIIENDLEYSAEESHNNSLTNQLPYVRVFSLLRKRYFFVHVEDLKTYEYNHSAIEKLVLPNENKLVLNKLFSVSSNNIHNDLVANKGGGLIILAEGEPGTGKTSTAEVYAELKGKALYILQVEELGTSSKELENNLTKILNRIQKWNAILLFDEVDIFLSKRNENLEKSAIVGIFLRLFEYFNGILFFTTNRMNSLDEAVLSRVTLVIKYPKLDAASREKIWKLNLNSASLEVNSLSKLAAIEMNGREIRNYVKLSSMLYENKVSETEIIELIERFPKN